VSTTSATTGANVPKRTQAGQAISDGQKLQRELWGLAGQALAEAPLASAPRLYVESLNEMIDMQTVRVAALNNRVPGAVLTVEVLFAAVALGLLAFRPRPADTRPYPRPGDAAHQPPRIDGAAPGGRRTVQPLITAGRKVRILGRYLRGRWEHLREPVGVGNVPRRLRRHALR
jgi:hypothetical protein